MTDTSFAQGFEGLKRAPRAPIGVGLSEAEREQLCRTLLAELGAPYVRRQGDELIHPCIMPFKEHKDQFRNPTASINFVKLVGNCFGCGAGGSLTWFVAVCKDLDPDQARGWLSQRTQDRPEDLGALLRFFDQVYAPTSSLPPPIPHLDKRILSPWLAIHPYMTEVRRIPERTLMRYLVGYDPRKDRIVIPHFWDGALVGWQTRRLGTNGPKYRNSPELPCDRTLYHYDRTWPDLVVVESVMSVLSKDHLHPRFTATFGAEVTQAQVRLLSRHRRVTLFFDPDPDGQKATVRVGQALTPYCVVDVAANPYAADPADLDDAACQAALDGAVPFALWFPPTRLLSWDSREI